MKHANVACVEVVFVDDLVGGVELWVIDDGIGFDMVILVGWRDEGYFGLWLLRDLVDYVGGTIEVCLVVGIGIIVVLWVSR